jgi:propanediol dehydratase small subunit
MNERLSVEAAVEGRLQLPDLRMDPETLRFQADQAQADGNHQLAENLRRAAELVLIPDEELMSLYEALRPHRSTASELQELAQSLVQRDAPRCAELVFEAAQTYERRGLLR